MATFLTDLDRCLNRVYESHCSEESSSSADEYTALVESLMIPNPANMDDNLSSPMSNYTYTSMSSNMSPISTASEGSTYNLQNLNIVSNGNDYNPNYQLDIKYGPYLTMIEEPVEKFRFRYKSEMHGTHGSLSGRSSSSTKKSFPTVHLNNYHGQATVRCSLSQLPSFRNPRPAPHSHSLVIRLGNDDKKDPHEIKVSQAQGYLAVFQGMGIIHTARKFIEDELYAKFLARMEFERTQTIDKEALKSWAKREASEMNLNQVCLCFEAFEQNGNDWIRISDPIYSKPINNMKSALTGELKISRLSTVVGSPSGGEELFMFVEKVGKKNIKVRFCETDDPEHDADTWVGWGKFTEADVHHQYGIALRTPKFKDGNLEKTVKIYIQLYRPSDNALSEALEFYYKPASGSGTRKRARTASISSLSEVPSVVNDVHNMFNVPDSQYFQDTDISNIMETWSSYDWENLAEYLDDDNSNNLAKDSVSMHTHLFAETKEIETFIVNTLKKIWTIMLMSAQKSDFDKGRSYIETLFRDVKLKNESVLDWSIKIENQQFLVKLLEVIQKCHLQKVLRFTNEYNENCLHTACLNNKPERIRLLMKYGADPNLADNKGDTPMHIAIKKQNINCVTALLADNIIPIDQKIRLNPVTIDVYNDNGLTPFHTAIETNNLCTYKLLEERALSENISIYERVELKRGDSILHIAVENHSSDIVRDLLKNKKIDVNKCNAAGQTALYVAQALAGPNPSNIVQLLLQYNAVDTVDVECKDTELKGDKCAIITNCDIKQSKGSSQSQTKISEPNPQIQRKETPMDPTVLMQLCQIFNENDKWKRVAIELGYQGHIDEWQKRSDPSKMMFKFAEAIRIPRKQFLHIFVQMNELTALEIMHSIENKK